MCDTCGCDDGDGARLTALAGAGVEHPAGTVIALEARVLGRNDDLAAHNRSLFEGERITVLNLMSSPGSGKTTLLERTLRDLAGRVAAAVVEGDQETPLDAERIRAAGAPVVQVNTGAGCHLDAAMVARAVEALAPTRGTVLFIENVGNLVCPALFDLGERARILITSVTEGPDKPLKYPHMFRSADLVLLNKADLLPHVDFDVGAFARAVATVNPEVEMLVVSARTGAGLEHWYERIDHLAKG